MTDAEIIADIFGSPCDYSPIDEEMMEMNHDECAEVCGKRTDAECWQRYFDLKREEDNL